MLFFSINNIFLESALFLSKVSSQVQKIEKTTKVRTSTDYYNVLLYVPKIKSVKSIIDWMVWT